MKIIFKIAKNEFRNLFYSPVAWFLTIVFFVQCAYFYIESIYQKAVVQDSNFINVPGFHNWGEKSLTATIFYGEGSLITNISQNLYLFIPLLTMGLMSREVNTGTIKLLYSSPVKLRQIVLGKYMAVMMYNLILLSIIIFFMVTGAFQIQSVDYGLLFSALLGFYLLVSAYSAIGLFMSSLTTYQIISGVGTFTVIFILGQIGTLWQNYDVIRDFTYFLSITGRTNKMLSGLITTKDVFYFLILVFMFLSFTLFKLKDEKESKLLMLKIARYTGVLIISILLGYISSRPSLTAYWDTTADRSNTINLQTQKILKQIDKEPLEVTLYANLFDVGFNRGLAEVRNPGYLAVLWEQYLRFKPDIKFNYVYYYDNDGRKDQGFLYKQYPGKTEKQIANIWAEKDLIDPSIFIGPEEIRKQVDPYSESRLFMVAKYKGRRIHIRTYTDNSFWPNQQEIASKLKRLVDNKWPKIYFVRGNLERNIYKSGEREYSIHSTDKLYRDGLINYGFDCDTLSLETHDIPSDITALVLADPKIALGSATRNKIRDYINKGGNLMVLGEPGKQAILNPVLEQLGVQLMKGQLVELNTDETSDKVSVVFTESSFKIFPDGEKLTQLKKTYHLTDTSGTFQGIVNGVTAVSYIPNGKFTISPIYRTFKNNSWLKMGRVVIDSLPPVFNAQVGDIKESSFAAAVMLTRPFGNREQRILVFGDADQFSNGNFAGNKFQNNIYSWFNQGQYPVFMTQIASKDNLLTVTAPTVMKLKYLYVWILPGLMLIAGSTLLIRRKRK